MASALLGEQFDIHTGGIDHIPVHHTNEIAQSEAAFEKEPVKYWMHGEFLVIDKGKMAKSGEKFLTLSVLEEKGYAPLAYRYFCLSGHYRQQLQFSWEALDTAKASYERLKNIIGELQGKASTVPKKYAEPFQEALDDDLNMPKALAVLWDALRDKELKDGEKLAVVEDFDTVLGLDLLKQESVEVPAKITALAEKREQARADKDWDASDKLRDEIAEQGWQINDTKDGYKLKKK
jgi:cysteinyl-tRNA synthetase